MRGDGHLAGDLELLEGVLYQTRQRGGRERARRRNFDSLTDISHVPAC